MLQHIKATNVFFLKRSTKPPVSIELDREGKE
jgi:hypothetical protein